MSNNSLKFFILTGDPGVGKTTLTKKISSMLSENGVKTCGFYTEEVRRNRVRDGFDIVTMDGQRGRLARDLSLLDVPVTHKVGKYGVVLQEFEKIALPSLEMQGDSPQLLVIDEVGKMELFSASFKQRIEEIFSPTSERVVLATIPVRKSDRIIEEIRHHSKAKVWDITIKNRISLHEEIVGEMKKVLNLN